MNDKSDAICGKFIPYLYASDILDDTTSATPRLTYLNIDDSLAFYLKVTDNLNNECFDTVVLTSSYFVIAPASFDFNISLGDSVFLNFGTNVYSENDFENSTYCWLPAHGLSDNTLRTGFWAKPDSTISYSVTVTDSKGCSLTGGQYYTINVLPAGIEEFENNKPIFNIYPNPTSDYIFIDYQTDTNIKELKLVSISGQQLVSQKDNLKSICLEDISAGVYVLEITTTENEIFKHKIVKQ